MFLGQGWRTQRARYTAMAKVFTALVVLLLAANVLAQQDNTRHGGGFCHREFFRRRTINYQRDKLVINDQLHRPRYPFSNGIIPRRHCVYFGNVGQGRQVTLVFSNIFLYSAVLTIETYIVDWKYNTTITGNPGMDKTILLRGVLHFRIVIPHSFSGSFTMQYFRTNAPTVTPPTTSTFPWPWPWPTIPWTPWTPSTLPPWTPWPPSTRPPWTPWTPWPSPTPWTPWAPWAPWSPWEQPTTSNPWWPNPWSWWD